MTDHALFRNTLRHLSKGMVFTTVLSCFVIFLMLIVPLYTMQVYDRVMTSRSTDTLIMLAIVAVGGLMLYAVLDYIRTRVLLIMGDVIGRRLNVPTLEAAVIDTLHGTSKNSTQAIRDLNDLRSLVTGNAITVPLEVMWVPLFLMSVLTDVLTRCPLAQANEAVAKRWQRSQYHMIVLLNRGNSAASEASSGSAMAAGILMSITDSMRRAFREE